MSNFKIRIGESDKTITLPFYLNYETSKEDIINEFIDSEGKASVNDIVDNEVITFDYSGNTLEYKFNFFCCDEEPFTPYREISGTTVSIFKDNEEFVISGNTLYKELFINSFAREMTIPIPFRPQESLITGDIFTFTDFSSINTNVFSKFFFIYDFFDSPVSENQKRINRQFIYINKSFIKSEDIYFVKRGEFKRNNDIPLYAQPPSYTGYSAATLTTSSTPVVIPRLSLNKLTKSPGYRIILPNDVNDEIYLKIRFFNPIRNKLLTFVSTSGVTTGGTIFLRSNYNTNLTYLKLILDKKNNKYSIYRSNGGDWNILVNGSINLFEVVINDLITPTLPSVLLDPNTSPPPVF